MTFLTFATILLLAVLLIEKLVLEPLAFLGSLQLPTWLIIAVSLFLLAWLMREQ